MLYFPQLSTGAVSQFPVRKVRSHRTVQTVSEDGYRFAVPDEAGMTIRWVLSYTELSDEENQHLLDFFKASEGRLQSFTFFDPIGNLLFWSENPDHPVWQKSSFVQSAGNVADLLGSSRAFRLTNAGAAALPFEQTINVPGNVTCCMSVYARSDGASSIALSRASGSITQRSSFDLTRSWQRLIHSTKLDGGDVSSTFGLTLSAGSSADLFGFQVNPQPGASIYVATFDHSGVYPATRFDQDSMTIIATAPNRNSCSLALITQANG